MSVLTAREISLVQAYMADDRKLFIAIGQSTTRRRRSPEARRIARGDYNYCERRARELLAKLNAQTISSLKELCAKYEYCKNRKNIETTLTFVSILVGIADRLAELGDGMAGAIAQLVFLIKKRMLDGVCECDKAA